MLNTQEKRIIISTTIGSIFEIFDFLAFVFMSAIIADLFFPKNIHGLAILFTYLTITISYLLRPIGGLILGHLGDRYGRKSIFIISILLMSIPSFAIGLMPTFSQIGYVATVLLIICRICQGFSVGGEVPGSITYIAEKFSTQNHFFYCAWLTFGANMGVALGSQSLKLLTSYTSHEFMYSIGWRIPFLVGGLLTIVGFYIRKSIGESEQFKAIQKTKQLSKAPLLTLFRTYRVQIICGILLSIIVSLTTSVFHIFLPNLFITYFHLTQAVSSNITAIGALTLAISSLIIAYFSRYISPIIIIRTAITGLIIVMTIITLNIVNLQALIQHNVNGLYLVVFIISLLLAGVNGLFFGMLASLFPTNVRFSGVSVCYNFAFILGAGLTPLWTSSILSMTHNYQYITGICLIVALIAFINTFLLQKFINKH